MTSVWGPACWDVFHGWCLSAWRAGDDEQAKRFYTSFVHLLRCFVCKKHYIQMIREHPPDTTSLEALFAWTVDRHNETNQRLGKPWFRVEDAWIRYVAMTEKWVKVQTDFYDIVRRAPKNHLLDWKLFCFWWAALGLHQQKPIGPSIALALAILLLVLLFILVVWLLV